MSNVSAWSQTDSVNGTGGSPPDFWSEGQAPSTVNNCARAMMGGLARWYQQAQGALLTTGTAGAYVLATDATNPHTALADIGLLVFEAHVANTAAPTIAVDGLAAKTIKKNHNLDLVAGNIELNQIVVLTYNTNDDTFELLNPAAGNMHIQEAVVSSGLASALGFDQLIIENPSASGISLITSTLGTSAISFSDTAADRALISFNHSLDQLTLNNNAGGIVLNASSGEIVVNDGSNDVNFRVETNGVVNTLFVDGGNDAVGMGTSTPGSLLHLAENTGALGPELRLEHNDTTTADNDVAGFLTFYAKDSGATSTSYGSIDCTILDVTNTDERSRFRLRALDNGANSDLEWGPDTNAAGAVAGSVLYLQNASTSPTGNPSTGGYIYIASGALRYRGSSGTDVELATA